VVGEPLGQLGDRRRKSLSSTRELCGGEDKRTRMEGSPFGTLEILALPRNVEPLRRSRTEREIIRKTKKVVRWRED